MKNCAPFLATLLLIVACTESTQPVEHPVAVRLAALSRTSQLVVADGLVPDRPAVTAYDAKGVPVAGAVVTFAIESGTGTIEHSVDTTDANGVVRLRLWRVGTKTAVRNVVTARLSQGEPVSFAVTVIPGPPAFIRKVFGDNLVLKAFSESEFLPLSQVLDAYENPIPGYPVEFAVTKGGGRADQEGVTDGLGMVSQVGWVAGDQGDQVLQIKAGAASATFSAIAVNTIAPCAVRIVLDSIAGTSEEMNQCMRDGQDNVTFYVRNPSANPRLFDVSSISFYSHLELRDLNSKLIARNINSSGLTDPQMRVAIAPGIYQLLVFQGTGDTGGTFYVRVQNAPRTSADCDGLFVSRGVTLNGVPSPFACTDEEQPVYANRYRMHLYAGETVGATLKKLAADFALNDYQIVVTTEDGDVLATGTPSAANVDVDYKADRELDVLITVSAVGPNFPYSITLR